METRYYTVISINGDYADLQNEEQKEAEPMLVARALLPEDIYEGCRLKYEMLSYELL